MVNFTALYLLHGVAGLPLLPAQLLGAEIAFISNFLLHTHWTYRGYTEKPLFKRLAQFHATAWSGGAISTGVLLLSVHFLEIDYKWGLVLGSIVAMLWNFFWTKFHIWPSANKVGEREQQS